MCASSPPGWALLCSRGSVSTFNSFFLKDLLATLLGNPSLSVMSSFVWFVFLVACEASTYLSHFDYFWHHKGTVLDKMTQRHKNPHVWSHTEHRWRQLMGSVSLIISISKEITKGENVSSESELKARPFLYLKIFSVARFNKFI